MKIVGLTGGIGSGKTIVAELLRVMDVPVYDSDVRSKRLCDTDESLKMDLIGLFGPELYADGLLNRVMLAGKIFGDENLLREVNSLIHPAVVRDFMEWVRINSQYPFVVMESAILFEAGLEQIFDRIITVSAPENIRLERVCKRSDLSPESVQARINNQITEVERVAKSDIVVFNDDVQAVIPQVLQLFQTLSF